MSAADFVDPDGNAVDQILAQEDVTQLINSADRVLFPLTDNLGTVRDLIKNDGVLGEHYQYDSFGAITSGNTSLTRYLFTSREFDVDTGLQYNRARYYDPLVGRFLNHDPLGFAAGDTNTYRYVGNSVTNATDPSGEFIFTIPTIILIAITGGVLVAATPVIVNAPNPTDTTYDPLGAGQLGKNAAAAATVLTLGGAATAGVVPLANEVFSEVTGIPVGVDDVWKAGKNWRKYIENMEEMTRRMTRKNCFIAGTLVVTHAPQEEVLQGEPASSSFDTFSLAASGFIAGLTAVGWKRRQRRRRREQYETATDAFFVNLAND